MGGHLVVDGIDIYSVPSMHSNILDEPAKNLSEKLRECLDRDALLAASQAEP